MSKEEKKNVRVAEVGIPVGIQPGTKLLQLRYLPHSRTWKLWLHRDITMQYGTFLLLSPDGGIRNITLRPDGTEDEFVVK